MRKLLWLLLPALTPLLLGQGPFVHRAIATVRDYEIHGAALNGSRLYTWGGPLVSWNLADWNRTVLSPGPAFGEGGCTADFAGERQGLVLQEGAGLGTLVFRNTRQGLREIVDTQVEMHDCLGAVLFGRRGVLVVHRYGQLRFYEPPKKAGGPWVETEIYSFYTPSQQGGLLMADVDGDGHPDIFCGNYWIKSPERFELPWHLFAINTYNEAPLSATAQLVTANLSGNDPLGLIFSEGEVADARLTWFERPAPVTDQWIPHKLEGDLHLSHPHGLAAADFNGDGRPDLFVAENNGAGSRTFVFWNEGAGQLRTQVVATGTAVLRAWVRGRDVLTAGPHSIDHWSLTRKADRP